jgi:hypothetical protein
MLVLLSTAMALAQNQQAQPAAQPAQAEPATRTAGPVSPLRLEVVLSRTDAKGTRVSRMPYVFSLAPQTPGGSTCRVRMGAQVPIPSGTTTPAGVIETFTYRSVGTNIDCSVYPVSEGRFQIMLSIDESSVVGEDMIEPSAASKFAAAPILRSYQSTNSVILRNGESARFTTAVDRVTGETVVAEVTLTVLK